MDLDTMTIRAGARLNFNIERADPDAVSATFLAVYGSRSLTDTVNYDSDGIAAFQFDAPDTDYEGDYEYQVSENFATGSPDIYPNFDNCDGDCDLPILQICESLSIGSS